ncbi:GatB/YqeY domain-containing protein [Nitrosomonas communis]|uniref:GatB/YqeY domain-containing protein n=1 Tax=Nitrosomonas communis TaxID=44574 RepID=UPI0026ECAB3C|nr:GatB/YqeY domain-containing protein [Nitrosomonas communis]
MNLKQRITEDMKAAMRAGDSKRRDAIRLLRAAIKQREVDKRIELDDAAIIAVIEKMLKQRRDSIVQYEAARRQDLADAEKYEVDVLRAYMPQMLSEVEIDNIVNEIVADVADTGQQRMGKIMALLKARLAGCADMAQVAALVKKKISS